VLELTIGVTILLVLIGSLMQSLSSLSRGTVTADINSDLQVQGEQAMGAIIEDLKRSGFASVGANAFPYLFLDGNATGAYAASAHPAAVHTAKVGEADFGPNREMVFLQPADANADNRPDISAAGQMIWNATQFSFVVVTRADGVNVLERRTDGVSPRKIAHHIERVAFDDNTTSGFQVPMRAIRVRIWFRRRDERGAIHRFFTEAVIKLRNG
jgi:hypothetical protein